MEQVYGWKVALVGAISIARPILFSVSAPVAGYLTPRLGERFTATFGMGALTVSMLIFAHSGPSVEVVVLVIALCLSGLGMGVSSPSTSSTQANEVDPSEFGVMSAAQLLALQVGEVVGIQVSVTVLEAHAHNHGLTGGSGAALVPSFRLAFLVGAIVAAAGTVCAAFIKNLDRDRSAVSEAA
jgi:MFS family permease